MGAAGAGTAPEGGCVMPYPIIRDNRFARRYLLRNAAKMIPLVIGLFALWRGWGNFGPGTWIGIVSFVGGILLWAWEDRQFFRSFRCPRCGQPLPQPTITARVEGDPIRFACDQCQVVWDTGLSQ
jgi:hypothetical protein